MFWEFGFLQDSQQFLYRVIGKLQFLSFSSLGLHGNGHSQRLSYRMYHQLAHVGSLSRVQSVTSVEDFKLSERNLNDVSASINS